MNSDLAAQGNPVLLVYRRERFVRLSAEFHFPSATCGDRESPLRSVPTRSTTGGLIRIHSCSASHGGMKCSPRSDHLMLYFNPCRSIFSSYPSIAPREKSGIPCPASPSLSRRAKRRVGGRKIVCFATWPCWGIPCRKPSSNACFKRCGIPTTPPAVASPLLCVPPRCASISSCWSAILPAGTKTL